MYSRIYVEITNICNMSCSFCHGHSRTKKQMTIDEFNIILNKLQGLTEHIYFHLMGEPLTHPLIAEFIKIAREKGFKPIITTNGTLLSKKGDDIINAGVYKVNISLHSFEQNNIDALSHYIDDICEFCDKASSNSVLCVLRLWNNDCDNGMNEHIINHLKEKLVGEWANNTKGIRIRNKLHLEWGERFGWPDKDIEVLGDEVFCYGLSDHFGILADGTVVPCCLDSDGVINLGNAHKDDIANILSSPKALSIKKGFEKRLAVEELCKRCPYARRF